MSGDEIKVLKDYFKEKHLHVSDIWLESCLGKFRSDNNNYTESVMCSQILEQWLLTDLRGIGVSCLPQNLKSQSETTLSGNFAVQVLCCKDISEPSLKQLNTIRDEYKLTQNVDDEENIEVNRMLDLVITDGVQNINAFEYEYIHCLDINMAPGIKIMLVGPLQVCDGEILLEPQNVVVLGGKVETLLVCNSVENIYARNLNKPENPNPTALYKEPSVDENAKQRSMLTPSINISSNEQNENIMIDNPIRNNDPIINNLVEILNNMTTEE